MTQHFDPEQDLDLEYVVRVRTFGNPSKVVSAIGKRLAKSSALALGNVVVTHGDQEFTWSPTEHAG